LLLYRRVAETGTGGTMSLSREQVLHIARLARVGVEEDEVERLAHQLSDILDYFERLKSVDTEGVPPTAHTLPLHNVWRDDSTEPCLDPEAALANAPQREGDLFRVKAILDE
jgi:aspartyl-tRNA(Asn)/glutamyl-tRNA(Gln) amidotransferase subunit C